MEGTRVVAGNSAGPRAPLRWEGLEIVSKAFPAATKKGKNPVDVQETTVYLTCGERCWEGVLHSTVPETAEATCQLTELVTTDIMVHLVTEAPGKMEEFGLLLESEKTVVLGSARKRPQFERKRSDGLCAGFMRWSEMRRVRPKNGGTDGEPR